MTLLYKNRAMGFMFCHPNFILTKWFLIENVMQTEIMQFLFYFGIFYRPLGKVLFSKMKCLSTVGLMQLPFQFSTLLWLRLVRIHIPKAILFMLAH